MFSSSLDTLLKVFKTTSPQKLFAYECVTLYCSMVKSSLVCCYDSASGAVEDDS